MSQYWNNLKGTDHSLLADELIEGCTFVAVVGIQQSVNTRIQ